METEAGLKVAVIGAGISGLVVARGLDTAHDVTLFEAEPRAGGHACSVTVEDPAGPMAIDTGFIIFNRTNYPRFARLLDDLGIASQPTDMSFSVRSDHDDVEWCGSGELNRIFGQRRNLVRPRFWRMLVDIVRFGRDARRVLADSTDQRTIGEFAAARGYGYAFIDHYLLPMGASLWSCPEARFAHFPVRFVAAFMDQHGLLDLWQRPQWRSLPGGSRVYVERLLAALRGEVRLGEAVQQVRRSPTGIEVDSIGGRTSFDEAVLACHADQALALLAAPEPTERELLQAFPYEANEAILHHDPAALPRRQRCWAAWNHRAAADREGSRVAVTYNMNILQSLPAQWTWCVTLNDDREIDPTRIIQRMRWSHPLQTATAAAARARHPELIRRRRISYCGAYWGCGFHEDGVASATRVLEGFGLEGP